MTDSLVLGAIELLGGGVASTHPQAAGAIFRLGNDFDLSAPQMTSDQVAGLLLDGSTVTGVRATNRTPTLPVVIIVPSTGDALADTLTLAGARELLLQTAAQESFELTWTRDGGLPLIWDCMGLSSIVINYSLKHKRSLVSLVQISFQALPYGRSDTQEVIVFNQPSQQWATPPAPVTIDDYSLTTNFLTGDQTGFEGGIAQWVGAGNATIAQTAAQAHSGTKSLQLTSVAAGNMQAAHTGAGSIALFGLPCSSGDTVNVKGWYRSAVTGRSCNMGADFYDAQGVLISTLRGSNITDTTVGQTQATAAVIAPSGTAFARASGQVLATGAAAEVHYLDDVTLDRGPVFSADDSGQWSQSTTTAVVSQKSARWSRVWRDCPIYDHILSAPLDITGRTKFTFWFGLGTTSNQWPVWHQGKVSFSIVLYDATGQSVSIGFKRKCSASALELAPHWNYISAHIPQMPAGFDYTTVSRYVITAWNVWDSSKINGATGAPGQPILQSGAFFCFVQASATTAGTPAARGAWYQLPGIVGTARAPLAIQAAGGPSSFSTVTEFTTAGVQNWTAPAGLTKVDKVETWGAGGGGSGANNNLNGGGGGGGGEYAMEVNVPVTALTVYHPNVGAAGTGSANSSGGPGGTPGGDTTFAGDSGQIVRAHGGKAGWLSPVWGGGKGGTGSSNYVHYSGGNGRQSNVNGLDGNRGGAGGGSAGASSGGTDAVNRDAVKAVADGGPGGAGGATSSTPHTGSAPTKGPGGGGGGGAHTPGTDYAGANGFAGKVRLSYGATGLLPLSSLLVHVPPIGAPDALSPLTTVGNGADVPNGATEYPVPKIGNLNPRFSGSYTMYLVAGTWNTPSAARDLTVQLRQYPYSGGTATTLNVARKAVTPTTDITNGYVDMGAVTLPLNDVPPGNTDAYFGMTVTSSNTADRMLDVLLIDSQGQLILVNVIGASIYNNIWIDQPDASHDLGRISGSDADRDRAFSLLQYLDRYSGGPLAVYPDANNRLLVYSAQGSPAVTGFYPPQWWTERLT